MPEPELPDRFNVGIPYFFYDFIGRILPGAFLITATALTWNGIGWVCGTWNKIKQLPSIETGAATLVLILGLLIFINASALAGSMLASLAHQSVGKLRGLCAPLTVSGLNIFLGANDLPLLRRRFKSQFKFDLTNSPGALNGASNLCAYHLISVSPTLGTMSARHDAELLGAQSMLLSIGFLVVVSGIRLICHFQFPLFYWFLTLLVALVGYGLTFQYHRKKRLYGRFALYLAAPDHKERFRDSDLTTEAEESGLR